MIAVAIFAVALAAGLAVWVVTSAFLGVGLFAPDPDEKEES